MYITTVVFIVQITAVLQTVLEKWEVKTLQVNIGTDWESFGLQEETGRKFQRCSLYNSHRARSLEMDNTDSDPHLSNVHSVRRSTAAESPKLPRTFSYIFQELEYFHIFLLNGVCKVLNFLPLPCSWLFSLFHYHHFLKVLELINWVLTLIKNKNML